jgi:large subunit ribosomal protein L4
MATKVAKIVKKAEKVVIKKAVAKKTQVKIAAKVAVKIEAELKTSAPTSPRLRGASKIAVSKPAKTVSLNASVYDLQGKVAGTVTLPAEIFGAKINDSLMSQAVRIYLANQRQGTSKVLDRSEVDRTTKKIYQQKGTGRARHGSRRAPIYVGGGKVFGPTPRDLSLGFSKKMKTLSLLSALSSKLKDGEIKVIKGLEAIEPKTKLMAQVLKDFEIKHASKTLLIMPKSGKELKNIYRAGRNIEGLVIVSANSLSTYGVLDNKLILIMRDSIDIIKNTFIHTSEARKK